MHMISHTPHAVSYAYITNCYNPKKMQFQISLGGATSLEWYYSFQQFLRLTPSEILFALGTLNIALGAFLFTYVSDGVN
jgi:hypothetical protein